VLSPLNIQSGMNRKRRLIQKEVEKCFPHKKRGGAEPKLYC
jgi:hypothetical protein